MVAKTVLVVEDDPCTRIVAEEMFLAAGFEVESVQRADHALASRTTLRTNCLSVHGCPDSRPD